MTAPQPQGQQTTDTGANTPTVTAAHTWAFVGLTTLSTILSAFAPKIQHYAAAHPTGTIVAGGLASLIAGFLPSASNGG